MLTLTNPELYNEIVAGEHWFESRLVIGPGTWEEAINLYDEQIISISTQYGLFSGEEVSVGGCIASELTAVVFEPERTVPKMALVRVLVRACNSEKSSEWISQGFFWIDTREVTQNDDGLNILTLHCYDAMLKTEADFPVTTHSWPASALTVVYDIATKIGVGVDSRTVAYLSQSSWEIFGLPLGYSMREVLSQIANKFAGNWVMTYLGQLRLVLLGDIPPETNYLVTAQDEAITFGGDRILV